MQTHGSQNGFHRKENTGLRLMSVCSMELVPRGTGTAQRAALRRRPLQHEDLGKFPALPKLRAKVGPNTSFLHSCVSNV